MHPLIQLQDKLTNAEGNGPRYLSCRLSPAEVAKEKVALLERGYRERPLRQEGCPYPQIRAFSKTFSGIMRETISFLPDGLGDPGRQRAWDFSKLKSLLVEFRALIKNATQAEKERRRVLTRHQEEWSFSPVEIKTLLLTNKILLNLRRFEVRYKELIEAIRVGADTYNLAANGDMRKPGLVPGLKQRRLIANLAIYLTEAWLLRNRSGAPRGTIISKTQLKTAIASRKKGLSIPRIVEQLHSPRLSNHPEEREMLIKRYQRALRAVPAPRRPQR